jgi:cell wall-associated NlpC family hydrolase
MPSKICLQLKSRTQQFESPEIQNLTNTLQNLSLPSVLLIMQKLFLYLFFIVLALLPEKADSKKPATTIHSKAVFAETEIRENLIAFAKNYIGTPYRYASIDPQKGFDCSGFVHFVFKNFDISVPHSSKGFKNLGNQVQPEDFRVGDVLVFYGYRNTTQIGHVGIICEANGMNSKFIHSSSGKVKGVIISELNSEMYTRRFYKCVDVIGNR